MTSKVLLDEKMIECVRKHEILYKTDMKGYSDNFHKSKIWREIAKICGMTSDEEAKKYWKNLRDGYRCALKMYKSNQADPTKKSRQWKYFEQMSFLRPYIRDRPKFNVGSDFLDDTETLDETPLNERVTGAVKEEMLDVYDSPDLVKVENEEHCEIDSPIPSKRLCLAAKSGNDELDESSSDMRLNQLDCQVAEDGLKLFFDSMYTFTKNLSPELQRVVKNKLFQAVDEAEAEMERNFKTNQK